MDFSFSQDPAHQRFQECISRRLIWEAVTHSFLGDMLLPTRVQNKPVGDSSPCPSPQFYSLVPHLRIPSNAPNSLADAMDHSPAYGSQHDGLISGADRSRAARKSLECDVPVPLRDGGFLGPSPTILTDCSVL